MDDLFQSIEENGLWQDVPTLGRNEFLKVSGSKDTNLYFVVEGCLRVFVEDEFEQHTIRFGYFNNYIAALDSFISENPSEYYIQALKKTKVKKVSKTDLMRLIHSSPVFIDFWVRSLESLVFQQLEREKDILISSPRTRYLRVLKRSPILFQEVPHKYIASYLRMTPETLSRIKKS